MCARPSHGLRKPVLARDCKVSRIREPRLTQIRVPKTDVFGETADSGRHCPPSFFFVAAWGFALSSTWMTSVVLSLKLSDECFPPAFQEVPRLCYGSPLSFRLAECT